MGELRKISLKEEINKEGERLEKELLNSEGMEVSEEMEAALFDKIQDYENEKKSEGKTVRYRRKKKRLIFALAAVLVLVCGSAMVSTGSKSYWKVLWEKITSDGNLSYMDVENMDMMETMDLDEVAIYKDVRNELGVSPVRFGYVPKGMHITSYVIDKVQKRATIFYEYNKEFIRFTLYVNDEDSSFGQKELDKLLGSYQINKEGHVIHIDEYEIEVSNGNRYVALFEHGGIHYQLKGIMEEEFEKIINNIFFVKNDA